MIKVKKGHFCNSCNNEKGPFLSLSAISVTMFGKKRYTVGVTIDLCKKCVINLGSKLARWLQNQR